MNIEPGFFQLGQNGFGSYVVAMNHQVRCHGNDPLRAECPMIPYGLKQFCAVGVRAADVASHDVMTLADGKQHFSKLFRKADDPLLAVEISFFVIEAAGDHSAYQAAEGEYFF